VATLTRLDTDRIVCKTIIEERVFGAMMAACGTLFLIVGLYAMQGWDYGKILFLLASLAIIWIGMILLGALQTAWLVIDLTRRTYKGRRGLLFWTERLRGPLEDFDQIRLVRVPADHREGCPGWALEFVWRHDTHRAFRVTHWRRPQSFHLEHCWGDLDSRSLLRNLKAMSQFTRLPLEVPKTYLDSLGLFDSEVDAM
jgi:hypothetical protein